MNLIFYFVFPIRCLKNWHAKSWMNETIILRCTIYMFWQNDDRLIAGHCLHTKGTMWSICSARHCCRDTACVSVRITLMQLSILARTLLNGYYRHSTSIIADNWSLIIRSCCESLVLYLSQFASFVLAPPGE